MTNPIILNDGTKEWRNKKGELHRKNGPAVEQVTNYSAIFYWYENGLLHREDGPASEENGSKSWYIKGVRHREDGPAVEYKNGNKEWWENGLLIKEINERGIVKYGSKKPKTTRIHDQVKEFHIAGNCPIKNFPEVPSSDRVKLRARLITEEYFEMLQKALYANYSGVVDGLEKTKQALYELLDTIEFTDENVDIVEFADSLGDLDYVIEGARLEFGINGLPIMDEIQKTNMAKFGPGSWKDKNGKVRKPPDWQPPDIAGKLKEQGWKNRKEDLKS